MDFSDFFNYNTNTFVSNLTNASFSLGILKHKTTIMSPTFPLIMNSHRDYFPKYMCAFHMITTNEFNILLIEHIYDIFFDKKITDNNSFNVLNALINFLNLNHSHPIINSALLHYFISKIKPLPSNNDDMANILSVCFLFKKEILTLPYFYFTHLQDIKNDNINDYINNYLSQMQKHANIHIAYLDTVATLRKNILAKVNSCIKTPKTESLVNLFFDKPILTAEDIEKELGITRGQSIRYLNTLEKNEILKGNNKQRNRTFVFEEFINIIFV